MSHRQAGGETDQQEVEVAVLGYLHRHPDAADTLDGIVSWWLPQQRYEMERLRIERVLSDLVVRGELRCDRLPGGAALYSLNRPATSRPH